MHHLPLPDAVDLTAFGVLLVGFSMPFVGIWIRYLIWKRRWRASRTARLDNLGDLGEKRR